MPEVHRPMVRFMDGTNCLLSTEAANVILPQKGEEWLFMHKDGTILSSWLVDNIRHLAFVRPAEYTAGTQYVALPALHVTVIDLLRLSGD